MSLPRNSMFHESETSQLGFNPVLLNADRRKALPKEPSGSQSTLGHDYMDPPSKPFWRTKRGRICFGIVAVIIVIGAIVGGIAGAKAGKGNSKAEWNWDFDDGIPVPESTSSSVSRSTTVASTSTGWSQSLVTPVPPASTTRTTSRLSSTTRTTSTTSTTTISTTATPVITPTGAGPVSTQSSLQGAQGAGADALQGTAAG